jgi:superfamily II DNA or RNA helicase
VQLEALAKLEATRAASNTAGLVVLATGLGKTWLSAFDSNRPEYRRILFVAHREEILTQSRDTFRAIRPQAQLGFYTGQGRDPHADVLFASIQTLGRTAHLERFGREAFDYIVVDGFEAPPEGSAEQLERFPRRCAGIAREFHHAAAA